MTGVQTCALPISVTMDEVFAMLERNAEVVRKVLFRAIELLPEDLFTE